MPDYVEDVLVVVPGLLGSGLERDGRPIWGTAASMARALVAPNARLGLRRSDGTRPEPGVEAIGLVGAAGQFPGLVKIDLYGRLLAHLRRRLALDDGNLLVFPYDWRLSNACNGTLLASAVQPVLARRRRTHPAAKLVFVCHSMGGLVVQHFTDRLGGGEDTRRVISFGTPFRGAARALGVLAGGWPRPLPVLRARFRRLARTLPSVHELLPRYRALIDGDHLRALSLDDLRGITDPGALARAEALHHELDVSGARPYQRTVVIGTDQVTPQFVSLVDGRARLHARWMRDGSPVVIDRRGDGTVPRQSVTPPEWADDGDAVPHAQSHVALPTAADAARVVHNAVTARQRATQAPAGPRLHLDVPDLVEAGRALVARAGADDTDLPVLVSVDDVVTGQPVRTSASPVAVPGAPDDEPAVSFADLAPGLYRISVEPAIRAPHVTPVWDLVTIVDPHTIPETD